MLIRNAVNARGEETELYLSGGTIQAVGRELAALAGPDEPVLDAGGLTVPAGLCGPAHPHWRTPGFEYKEDIETGSPRGGGGRLHLRQPDAQHQARRLLLGGPGGRGGGGSRTHRPVRRQPDRLHHQGL